ncbi:MAG: aminoacyl--tRNA ligase-related protein, partial [candidate division WOR-3 bacterium]
MILSKALIETLREDPKDAELKSHRLLLRAGFIKQHGAGIHTYLPLAWRVILKIANIIREEMDRIGSQELLMPALSPREIWEESGRWKDFGDDMFRLKDRKNRDYCLCPTHEEVITEIARNYVRSYRDLPQIWYQIQTKFRDEP